MPEYTVWYKKKVTAKNLKEAVNKEKRIRAEFSSIEEEEPEESKIGFNL